MKTKHIFYCFSTGLSLLATIYCFGVYLSGQNHALALGNYYLSIVPNYYLFYLIFLPFINLGMLYLAFNNRYIRFFGNLSEELDENSAKRLRFLQRLLPLICIAFSIVIVIQDGANRGHALPPFNYKYQSTEQKIEVARYYSCEMNWSKECTSKMEDNGKNYLKILQKNGVAVETRTGFSSISEWWKYSSWIYKYDTVLSFIASAIISIFLAQIFFLISIKNLIKLVTRNLVMWMLILASFWFPTKIYTSWSSNFYALNIPAIFLFGFLVLLLGIVLLFFLTTKEDLFIKVLTGLATLVSLSASVAGYFKTDLLNKVVVFFRALGFTYTVMIFILIFIGVWIITERLLKDYDEAQIAH